MGWSEREKSKVKWKEWGGVGWSGAEGRAVE